MQLGNLNLMILKSISESEKYGLEIIDDISKKTNGKTIVKQPSLYSGLRRLEQRGLISSRWEDSDIGGRRHYYAITNLGASELRLHDTDNIFDEDVQSVEEKPASAPEQASAPHEIPVENVFESKEDVTKRDEQTVSDLEKSFDDVEKQEEPKQENEQFAEYQPGLDSDANLKSFSDNMKEYVEPENTYDEYKLHEETPAEEEILNKDDNPQEEKADDGFPPQDTVVEYVHAGDKSSDDINYKDILGDLDADLNKTDANDEAISNQTIESEAKFAEQESAQQENVERPKSAYQKELEDILLSSKNDDATHNITIKETDRMAEVNRRYGEAVSVEADEIVEDETFDADIHRITPKDVGFTYINQEDITVKPYKKAKKQKTEITGEFLNVNKYNLIRASIMFVLMSLELLISYFVCNACGLFEGLSSTAVILYSVSITIAVLYYVISLVYTLTNLSKKIKTENISFLKDILYRGIMCLFIIAFIFGLNIFMGMPNTISWLIPCIMAINIVISWIVGLIMYKTKNFHA